jgi:hypothetical protein
MIIMMKLIISIINEPTMNKLKSESLRLKIASMMMIMMRLVF